MSCNKFKPQVVGNSLLVTGRQYPMDNYKTKGALVSAMRRYINDCERILNAKFAMVWDGSKRLYSVTIYIPIRSI